MRIRSLPASIIVDLTESVTVGPLRFRSIGKVVHPLLVLLLIGAIVMRGHVSTVSAGLKALSDRRVSTSRSNHHLVEGALGTMVSLLVCVAPLRDRHLLLESVWVKLIILMASSAFDTLLQEAAALATTHSAPLPLVVLSCTAPDCEVLLTFLLGLGVLGFFNRVALVTAAARG